MSRQTYASSTAEGGNLGAVLKKGSGAGNYSSASTSYVAVDAANLTYTIVVPFGFVLMVNASGLVTSLTAAVQVGVGLNVDGALVAEVNPTPSAASAGMQFGLQWLIVGDGNSHTVQLVYKTSNASDSVQVFNNTATHLPLILSEITQSNLN